MKRNSAVSILMSSLLLFAGSLHAEDVQERGRDIVEGGAQVEVQSQKWDSKGPQEQKKWESSPEQELQEPKEKPGWERSQKQDMQGPKEKSGWERSQKQEVPVTQEAQGQEERE